MPEEPISLERQGAVLVVTLNRPEKMNAITSSMLEELSRRFDEFSADDTLRAAVLTGAGTEAFCAGGDLTELIPMVTSEGLKSAVPNAEQRIFSNVYKPIIAAVNGVCIAGGVELLLGTDIRLAAPHAQFATPEVSWGLIGAGGICARLPRQVPWATAMEMLLTGDAVSAGRAAEIGLVNKVVPAEDLVGEAIVLAERIATNGPLAVRATKEAAVRGSVLEPSYRIEAEVSATVFASDDAREGLLAFAESRNPAFRGT